MANKHWNDILNPVLFVAGTGLVFTGILQEWVLPKGSPSRGLAWMGLNRHDWGEVHTVLAVVAVAAALLHLAVHWAWIRAFLFGVPAEGRNRIRGLAFSALAGALLLAAVVLPFAVDATVDPGALGEGGGQGWHGGR